MVVEREVVVDIAEANVQVARGYEETSYQHRVDRAGSRGGQGGCNPLFSNRLG